MLLCKYCNQERKNNNSLINHERLCKSNSNRQFTIFSDINFQKKNKNKANQYIKAKRLGLPKPEVSLEIRKKHSDAIRRRSKDFTKAVGKKVSKTIMKKVADGTWHTSLAKHMHINYKGVNLHGSWEYKYAQYLDSLNINWIRNTDSFTYEFDGKLRNYTPDFYLPDSDKYIEIKGYKTKKDDAKWSQFPKHRTLEILLKEDLQKLKVI